MPPKAKAASAKKASAAGSTRTIKGKNGQKPISFKEGGLHASTGTPRGEKIPASKMAAAKSGKLGPRAQKQAQFAANVLTGGRRGR